MTASTTPSARRSAPPWTTPDGAGRSRADAGPAATPPRLAKLLVGLSSQVALVTAALYYFGWARAEATYRYFGLDTSFADFAVTDYVLRSVPLVFTPLVPLLLLTFGATVAHTLLVTPLLAGTGRARRVARAVVQAARPACLVVLVAAVVSLPLQWTGGADLGVLLPVALTAATAGFAYCEHLDATHRLSPARATDSGLPLVVRQATLLGLAVAGTFWAVGLYAAQVGEEMAVDYANGGLGGSSVVLYATDGLGIGGPGVTTTALDPTTSKYHVRYSGLRLLLKTPDRYLLLPSGWRRGQDPVIVVADSEDVRADLTPQHRSGALPLG